MSLQYACTCVSPLTCINKSIKSGLREKWEDWMIERDGIVEGAAKESSSKLVTGWLVDVYKTFRVKLLGIQG